MGNMGNGVRDNSRGKSFVFAANNRNGFLCAEAIAKMGYCPKRLLLHPSPEQKYGKEIRSVFPECPVSEWDQQGISYEDLKADILLSVNFGYIFPIHFLALFHYPINLHMSYLPYNRGSHPNVWSIYDETPAGVTLHIMTPDVDNGEIIAQKEIPVSPTETGKSLYHKLERTSVSLLYEIFPLMVRGEINTSPMPEGGSFHLGKEFKELCKISLEEQVPVDKFLRRLRALSFPPYKNAFVQIGGKKIYIDISLEEKNE